MVVVKVKVKVKVKRNGRIAHRAVSPRWRVGRHPKLGYHPPYGD